MSQTAAARILVIDDDDSLREIFKLNMEREGFVVDQASDGVQGLAKAAAFKPHVIVLDLMMPGLNGFDTLHRLKLGDLGRIPVIVITGYSDNVGAQLVRQEPNVVDFLAKPIEYAELAAFIRKLLAH